MNFLSLFNIRPSRTERMKQSGLIWTKNVEGKWIMVCDFCGGNCGQCGLTSIVGNVGFSMERMWNNIGKEDVK